MSPAIQCLLVVVLIALFFVTEIIPLAVTAIAGAIACGLLGFIPVKQVFSGLSDGTIVLFAAMFVVGAAMFHTGLAQTIGTYVVKKMGRGEKSLMFSVMLITAILSAFLSNTGTTACLMPVVLGICAVAKVPASRQLMPLAFLASCGGFLTMVGCPPNLIAVSTLKAAGMRPFGFFEFAWSGVPMVILSMLYMLFIGRHLLPKAELSADQEIEQEIEQTTTDVKKQWYSGIILVVVVIALMFDSKWFTLPIAATIGALATVLTGCLTEKQAYHSIDWLTIFLLGFMLPVSVALEKSGAGALIASWVINVVGDGSSVMLLTIVLFFVGCLMTQFMSNTAATALLCPIGLSIAKQIGANPHAILMAIVIGASCAFLTPVATPPNTLILGPGNYKFIDYAKVGWGLVVIGLIVAVVIVPMVWPYFPAS